MRDALAAWLMRLRETAWQQWQFESLRWAMLAPRAKDPGEPPPVPEILR